MIFNSNTTRLSAYDIAMAEGYDCSYGAALALVESAETDYNMFRAMLTVDAHELRIQNESTSYVAESQMMTLTEASISGIWETIKNIFKKLAEKIKAIMHTFVAKITSLWSKDVDMLKKYENEVKAKKGVDDIEVKWVTYKDYTKLLSLVTWFDKRDVSNWAEDKNEREKVFLKCDPSKFKEETNSTYTNNGSDAKPSEVKLSTVGGISGVCDYLRAYQGNLKGLVKRTDKMSNDAATTANSYKKRAQDVKKITKMDAADEYDKTNAENAKKEYDLAIAYQDATMKVINWVLSADKNEYKQNKAAFMKAISFTAKKDESYLIAVGEAAEQEVDDVIDATISKEDFDDINKATLNVQDSDVSDDPDKLTYGPDKYTDDLYGTTVGTVDTEINSKEESAFFGRLFY